MAQTTYFVDTENVGCRWSSLLSECKQTDKFILIYTAKSPPLPMELFAQIISSHRKVECVISDRGPNALDFTLATELGRRVERDSAKKTKQRYVIVSNDKGYNAVLSHLMRQGVEVLRKELPSPDVSRKTLALPSDCTELDMSSSENDHILQKYREIMRQYPGVTESDIKICSRYLLNSMLRNDPATRKISLNNMLASHFGSTQKAGEMYQRIKHAIQYIAENGPFPQETSRGAA